MLSCLNYLLVASNMFANELSLGMQKLGRRRSNLTRGHSRDRKSEGVSWNKLKTAFLIPTELSFQVDDLRVRTCGQTNGRERLTMRYCLHACRNV